MPWEYVVELMAQRYGVLPEVIEARAWHRNVLSMQFMSIEAEAQEWKKRHT